MHMCKNRSFVDSQQILQNNNWFMFPFLISFTFIYKGVIITSLRQLGTFDDFKEILKLMYKKSLNVSLLFLKILKLYLFLIFKFPLQFHL